MSAAVPPARFYGKQSRPFVPPVLRSAATRRAVLASKTADTTDSSRVPFLYYPTQAQAFAAADAAPHAARVWSFELDATGRRRFIVAPVPAFWRWYKRRLRDGAPTNVYEVIRRGAACKAHFDLEFRRGDGGEADSVDGDALTSEVIKAVRCVASEWHGQETSVENRVELFSSTPTKYSCHLIFPSILFRSNAEAGDFALEVESRLSSLAKRLSFVDLAIYTPNRCFRLAGSSKFGRTHRLLPPLAHQAKATRPCLSETLFHLALVTNVAADCSFLRTPLRDVVEPEGVVLRRRHVVRPGPSSAFETRYSHSEWPRLDEYVMELISPRSGNIYNVTHFNVEAGTVVSYAIKGGWRYCARIRRHHKSNNVVLVASLSRREMFQRCFDPDCRGFRSEPWRIPSGVLPPPPELPTASPRGLEDVERLFLEDADFAREVLGAVRESELFLEDAEFEGELLAAVIEYETVRVDGG